MDNITNSGEAKQFLRGLGLTVDEQTVRQVVEILQGKTGASLYSAYAKRRDKQPPICGKGTAYKTKCLYKAGKLGPYLEYLSAESTTKQKTHKEEAHTRTMRALAGKLAGAISLPSLFNSNLWDSLPLEFHPGRYCLSIGVVEVAEDKQTRVNYYDVSADLAAPRLVKGLYSHLRTSGLPRFAELVGDEGKLNSWVVAVGQYSEALMMFLKRITDEVTDRANVNFHNEVKPGLTRWFIITVWIDAIRQAGGRSWIVDSWYRPPSMIPNTTLWKLDCRTEPIGIVESKKRLQTYENRHKQLRHRYANEALAKRIVTEGQELSGLADEIRERLWEFIHTEQLPGHCELCT